MASQDTTNDSAIIVPGVTFDIYEGAVTLATFAAAKNIKKNVVERYVYGSQSYPPGSTFTIVYSIGGATTLRVITPATIGSFTVEASTAENIKSISKKLDTLQNINKITEKIYRDLHTARQQFIKETMKHKETFEISNASLIANKFKLTKGTQNDRLLSFVQNEISLHIPVAKGDYVDSVVVEQIKLETGWVQGWAISFYSRYGTEYHLLETMTNGGTRMYAGDGEFLHFVATATTGKYGKRDDHDIVFIMSVDKQSADAQFSVGKVSLWEHTGKTLLVANPIDINYAPILEALALKEQSIADKAAATTWGTTLSTVNTQDTTGAAVNELLNKVGAVHTSTGAIITEAQVKAQVIAGLTDLSSVEKNKYHASVDINAIAIACAQQVELAIMNEGDGRTVLDAIKTKISEIDWGASDIPVTAVATAVWETLVATINTNDTIGKLLVDTAGGKAAQDKMAQGDFDALVSGNSDLQSTKDNAQKNVIMSLD